MRKLLRPDILVLTLVIWSVANPAHAYIGPGAGLGAIMITVALVLGLLLLLFGFVWYPLRRFLRGRKEAEGDDQE